MRLFLFILFLALLADTAQAQQQPAVSQTNLSGSVVTGGTFQTASPRSDFRRSLEFINTNASDACYLFIFDTGTPTLANSVKVLAGQGYIRSTLGAIPRAAIQLTCVTTGDTFYLGVMP